MSRIVLRKLTKDDREAVLELLLDSEVMKFLGPRRALTCEEAAEWYQSELQNPSRFVVALKNSDEFMGFCGIKKIEGILDFGYFLRKSFWGHGYGTEACKLVVSVLAGEFNFKEVEVFIAKENKASLAVASKLGWCQLKEATKQNELGYYYRVNT